MPIYTFKLETYESYRCLDTILTAMVLSLRVPWHTQILADQLTLFQPGGTLGTDYSHLITTGTPGFSDLPTALLSGQIHKSNEKTVLGLRLSVTFFEIL